MAERRSRGDGGLHYSEARKRWIATAHIGFGPDGKRHVKRVSGRTKTEASRRLKEVLRDLDDGVSVQGHGFTVEDALRDWLEHGLVGRDDSTVDNIKNLTEHHIIPSLGRRRLRELSADDVDAWLAIKARRLAHSTVSKLLSILRRAIDRQMARERVRRNVTLLCHVPRAQAGRPSKALSLEQAESVLDATAGSDIGAYVTLSLLIGARTEEMRALTWSHVDLIGDPEHEPPKPPTVDLWRSVRTSADTKTKLSRRTLALPTRCVDALKEHRQRQDKAKAAAGRVWQDHDLVFSTAVGTPLDAANVRRSFRRLLTQAGLPAKDWTPRELRHSFVSLLSDAGMPVEAIARLVGHRGTVVTEAVYRKQLRPVITEGAERMDEVFKRPPKSPEDAPSPSP